MSEDSPDDTVIMTSSHNEDLGLFLLFLGCATMVMVGIMLVTLCVAFSCKLYFQRYDVEVDIESIKLMVERKETISNYLNARRYPVQIDLFGRLFIEPIDSTDLEARRGWSFNHLSNETCAICLDSFHVDDILFLSGDCSHLFHQDCISRWLKTNQKCPCCRMEIRMK